MHRLMEIGSNRWKRLLLDGAARLGAPMDESQAEAFAEHARELLLWNRSISLTTITDPRAVAVKHFLDSLAPASLLPENARLLDIGSGGGFPGIPLKVLFPAMTVT
ncbi:MAG: 16S rRNA (guanine(527)-N(7))-methyltransferase RsmG, partial [Desulfobacterales bacterium]|nr:16S rRNA (guanine(527)-N(7))-methyltransferase RsmG [Desulfobacterales bacterium]